MGWTYTHKEKGESIIDFMVRSGPLSWSDDCPGKYTVLASAVVKMRTLYAAVERVDKATGERIVWAAVILLGYAPKDYYNFGYKGMDESMGPCEDSCPERILKLLTPTDDHYATEWRNRCWAKIQKKKAQPKIQPGVTVTLYNKDYYVEQALGRRGYRVHDVKTGCIYRINCTLARSISDVKPTGA